MGELRPTHKEKQGRVNGGKQARSRAAVPCCGTQCLSTQASEIHDGFIDPVKEDVKLGGLRVESEERFDRTRGQKTRRAGLSEVSFFQN